MFDNHSLRWKNPRLCSVRFNLTDSAVSLLLPRYALLSSRGSHPRIPSNSTQHPPHLHRPTRHGPVNLPSPPQNSRLATRHHRARQPPEPPNILNPRILEWFGLCLGLRKSHSTKPSAWSYDSGGYLPREMGWLDIYEADATSYDVGSVASCWVVDELAVG